MAYKADPYPTSADLIRLLRAEAGRQHQQLVTDLFEKIVLWDLAVTGSDATATEDGQWRVRIEVRARKLEADGKGEEQEAPLDQAIEVGLFMANPDRPEFTAKDVIRLEKRPIKAGKQTIELMSDRKPAFVGINPYLKLIERNIGDNVAPVP